MGTPFEVQQAAMEAAMQADVDAHAQAPGAPGGLHLPPPGMQRQTPVADQAMFQTFMQQFMQMMWNQMQQQPPMQAAQGGQAAVSTPAASSPQGAGHWREDGHMANVRLDERASDALKRSPTKRMNGRNGVPRS